MCTHTQKIKILDYEYKLKKRFLFWEKGAWGGIIAISALLASMVIDHYAFTLSQAEELRKQQIISFQLIQDKHHNLYKAYSYVAYENRESNAKDRGSIRLLLDEYISAVDQNQFLYSEKLKSHFQHQVYCYGALMYEDPATYRWGKYKDLFAEIHDSTSAFMRSEIGLIEEHETHSNYLLPSVTQSKMQEIGSPNYLAQCQADWLNWKNNY